MKKEIIQELTNMQKAVEKVELENSETSALLVAYLEINRIKELFTPN